MFTLLRLAKSCFYVAFIMTTILFVSYQRFLTIWLIQPNAQYSAFSSCLDELLIKQHGQERAFRPMKTDSMSAFAKQRCR